MAPDASTDDEQVVFEGFGTGAVVGECGGYCGGVWPAGGATVVERSGSESLAAESAEAEIRRDKNGILEGKRVTWHRNGGRRERNG